ncbi:MAG: twin-arginine translocase TatA/TatE family subunit, partial [Leucobacter sp.]
STGTKRSPSNMFSNMGGPTLIVIVFIVLLLFGAPKLPGLARSIGQSMKILKKEVTGDDEKTTETDGSSSEGSNTGETKKSE